MRIIEAQSQTLRELSQGMNLAVPALIVSAADGASVPTPQISPLHLDGHLSLGEPLVPISRDPSLAHPVLFHSDGRPPETGYVLSDLTKPSSDSGMDEDQDRNGNGHAQPNGYGYLNGHASGHANGHFAALDNRYANLDGHPSLGNGHASS